MVNQGGTKMMGKLKVRVTAGAILLTAASVTSVAAWPNPPHIDHVLLLSVDGMHAVDLINCAHGISGANQGQPYCSNLADLMKNGVNYVDTSTSKPSDSFPGLMALVTGASPRLMGVYYDHAYDRSLNPPAQTTGNSNPGGSCTPGATPSGTQAEFEEGIDFDQTKLNGGAKSGDGGVDSINPAFLSRNKLCHPVFPWNYIRVNTVYGVIHGARGYTAWSDKHPSYSSVGGPNGGQGIDTNVDDYYGPEINSNSQDYPSSDIKVAGCNPLPDKAAKDAKDDYTGSFQNIQCYDALKVQAVINQIEGMNHNATSPKPVPNIFGMNFQAVSVGEKLIYQHGTPPDPYSQRGGYLDSIGTPSPSLLQEIEFVDDSIGSIVSKLKAQHLDDSTLVIITAKHGQSPLDSSRYIPDGSNSPATILGSFLPAAESGGIGPTEDDVSLLWLTDSSKTAGAVELLEKKSPALPLSANVAGIGEILSGPPLAILYNTPGLGVHEDPRTPDIIVTPNVGVTYSNSTKKLAEHGGFSHDDTNVVLLVANPGLTGATVTSPVETAQVAPTILRALGFRATDLTAVRKEGTQVLPGLPF
jgi:hypothetical protein